jgi:hypothetical protein
MFFGGGDVPPDEPNEACPFPSVKFFLKSFPAIPQSDAAQRVNVHFFRATIAKRGPKNRQS